MLGDERFLVGVFMDVESREANVAEFLFRFPPLASIAEVHSEGVARHQVAIVHHLMEGTWGIGEAQHLILCLPRTSTSPHMTFSCWPSARPNLARTACSVSSQVAAARRQVRTTSQCQGACHVHTAAHDKAELVGRRSQGDFDANGRRAARGGGGGRSERDGGRRRCHGSSRLSRDRRSLALAGARGVGRWRIGAAGNGRGGRHGAVGAAVELDLIEKQVAEGVGIGHVLHANLGAHVAGGCFDRQPGGLAAGVGEGKGGG